MMASPSSKIKIIQTNLHHSQTATAQLRKWLEVHHTTIALIQEPWVRAGRTCGLLHTGGKVYYSTAHEIPRTCIYTSSNICAQQLSNFCSRDLTAIKITNNQDTNLPQLVIASVYMPDSDDPPPHELQRLVRMCEETGLELIVGTDANAHHPLWGMNQANNRGKILVDYLFTTNLHIINNGSEATFVNKRSRTIIDLTLATEKAAEQISNWRVSSEASCSDHRWILFELNTTTVNALPRRNPRKTDKN